MYNTGFSRFIAAILDGIFLTLISQIIRIFPLDNIFIYTAWSIFFAFFCYAYSIFCHYRFGQTIGKYLMDIKVFDVSETKKIYIKQAILRDSIGLLVLIYSLVILIIDLYNHRTDLGNALSSFESNANYVLGFWTIAELITMFLNKKRRAIHDYIAKTVVKKYNK